MDDVEVENVPYNVIPVTEYDPFEVRKYSRIVSYYKIMSTCYKSDFVASGKLYIINEEFHAKPCFKYSVKRNEVIIGMSIQTLPDVQLFSWPCNDT